MSTFTVVHIALSVVAIVAGVAVAVGMLRSRQFNHWTLLFLVTSFATSITGFGFQRERLLPSHVVGVVSLIFLLLAMFALYVFALARSWRRVYVISALVALYLNVFVLIVQAFQKVPVLHALAPSQSDPAFVFAQVLALMVFAAIGSAAFTRFQPRP